MMHSETEIQEIEKVSSTSQNAAQLISQLDNRQTRAKNREDYHWRVMACIRACAGDHTAGLVLNQLLYWWPRKLGKHRGVKKSVTDWEAELMLGEKPVKRINAKLKALGFVEIYLDTWGRYKSDATFYVLTPKALALLKAPLPTGGVVAKAPLPTGEVTENTKDLQKEEKTKTDSQAIACTASPAFPGTTPGEIQDQNQVKDGNQSGDLSLEALPRFRPRLVRTGWWSCGTPTAGTRWAITGVGGC